MGSKLRRRAAIRACGTCAALLTACLPAHPSPSCRTPCERRSANRSSPLRTACRVASPRQPPLRRRLSASSQGWRRAACSCPSPCRGTRSQKGRWSRWAGKLLQVSFRFEIAAGCRSEAAVAGRHLHVTRLAVAPRPHTSLLLLPTHVYQRWHCALPCPCVAGAEGRAGAGGSGGGARCGE